MKQHILICKAMTIEKLTIDINERLNNIESDKIKDVKIKYFNEPFTKYVGIIRFEQIKRV